MGEKILGSGVEVVPAENIVYVKLFVKLSPIFGMSVTSVEIVHMCSRHARTITWGEQFNFT